jgi:signal transduction histidine kinase
MTGTDIGTSPSRARLLLLNVQGPLLVSVAYYLGAEAAFLIGTLSDRIFAPFWPPNAILFCALALLPYRRWPLYIMAVFPAHVIAELGVGMGWSQLVVAFVTNGIVAVLSASGLRYLLGAPPWFYSLRTAIIYVLVAIVCSPGLSALGGAFVRVTSGSDLDNYWLFWRQWYAANALGNLTLSAVLLTWMVKYHDWSDFRSHPQRIEALFLVTGLLVACAIAFEANALAGTSYFPALLYLPLPFVIWAAVRFRTNGASVAILAVTVASISSVLHGPTVFGSADVEANVLALQLFLMVLSVSILLLGASVDELQRAEQMAARLARSVLGAQDGERREVARRLLDGIGQRLAAATWVTEQQPVTKGLEAVVHHSIRELRELSYLLHPPMLDEAGLQSALRARLDSYSECTGIAVTLEISGLDRLPADVELTIFRVIEEALANVEQHSGSVTARVSIEPGARPSGDSVVVTIEDAGGGMPVIAKVEGLIQRATTTTAGGGLGLARMRERLRRIGGELEINFESNKTSVRASIPVPGNGHSP